MKLDLAHVYQQIALNEDSKQYATINTLKCLHQHNHLPLRIVPAILITDETKDEHLRSLDKVLYKTGD